MRNEYTILIPKAEGKIHYGKDIYTEGEKLILVMKDIYIYMEWILLIQDKTSDEMTQS
jgi:hypothetical protein